MRAFLRLPNSCEIILRPDGSDLEIVVNFIDLERMAAMLETFPSRNGVSHLIKDTMRITVRKRLKQPPPKETP